MNSGKQNVPNEQGNKNLKEVIYELQSQTKKVVLVRQPQLSIYHPVLQKQERKC